MKKSNIKLSINELTGDYEIKHKGFSWISDGRRPYIILRRKAGNKYISTYRPLYSALKRTFEYSDDQIVTRLSNYVAFGRKLDFTLVLTAKITGCDTVEFSLKAENETGYDIRAVYFPAPFNSKTKGAKSYHVDAMRQGFLMPDGYKKNILSTIGFEHYLRKINTGDCYMPFWGRVCDGHGFCAIAETPYDACMFSSIGRRNAFVNSVHWCSSLGKLSYERKLRFIFHDKCDYNTIAKDYRSYLIETGQFVSIEDKIRKNKNIEKMIGTPVLHHRIFTNIQPASKFYKKNGDNQKLMATFDQRAQQLEKIKEMGLEKLYIHTDGWGKLGYDNNHPYILPPCPQAGGWSGLKNLADTCRRLGYIFALHDQYRDFYYTSPVYDKEKAVTNIDGSHPYCSIWDGGEHTFLCASQAPAFVKKTYTELEEHDIDVQGAYLDVFSVMWGDECFHPNHTITREKSIKHRGECFDYLNDKGLIMSSEEPAMQLLDKIALVHHGPYTLRPQEDGQAVGIPVPLGSLVYHDCILIPWNWWHNWGIPRGESGVMHCALNAGLPYFHPFNESETQLISDDALKAEIKEVKELAQIQAKLYNKEMVKHEFVGSFSCQKATYSDGTVITVDFKNNTYEVK